MPKGDNTNPYKANQYKADPRQVLFLEYYLDPKSKTFSNALQSAKKAGYDKEYAENITSIMPTWLSEKIGELQMLSKVQRNLNKFLDDDEDKRIQLDATKFVGETIGKAIYHKKQEIDVNIKKVEITEEEKEVMDNLLYE